MCQVLIRPTHVVDGEAIEILQALADMLEEATAVIEKAPVGETELPLSSINEFDRRFQASRWERCEGEIR